MTMDNQMAPFHFKAVAAPPMAENHLPLFRGVRTAVILAASLACLTACEDSKPARTLPRAQTAAAQKPQPAPVVQEAPPAEAAPVHEYAYSPVGKRDPFRSIKHDAEREAALQKAAAEAAAAASKPVEAPVENLRCGDPVGRRQIRDIILHERAKGTTILFCTHIIPDIEALCDHVAVLVSGRLRKEAGD